MYDCLLPKAIHVHLCINISKMMKKTMQWCEFKTVKAGFFVFFLTIKVQKTKQNNFRLLFVFPFRNWITKTHDLYICLWSSSRKCKGETPLIQLIKVRSIINTAAIDGVFRQSVPRQRTREGSLCCQSTDYL